MTADARAPQPELAEKMSPLEEAIWRRDRVVERTGLSSSQIDRMEADGLFPARRQVSEHTVGWLASEVVIWMRSRPAIQGRNKRAA